jgi:hypothetical protein
METMTSTSIAWSHPLQHIPGVILSDIFNFPAIHDADKMLAEAVVTDSISSFIPSALPFIFINIFSHTASSNAAFTVAIIHTCTIT